jgi:site-specific DNA recombinase
MKLLRCAIYTRKSTEEGLEQEFNTTSSMGRLTLNVLLSFAQFEREVTGERIRDKIAASKARGIWMGGNLPLGYDVNYRKLFIVEEEATLVRYIYSRYIEPGSVLPLVRELDASSKRTKRWTSGRRNVRDGYRFSCGAVYRILSNRIYLGDRHAAEGSARTRRTTWRRRD